MSTALHPASLEHIDRLMTLSAAFAEEMNIPSDATRRRKALEPLLQGSPHGTVYLIGPPRAPVGYLIVSFGWSLEFGGKDAFLDELFIRPTVRRRGMGSEALNALSKELVAQEVQALHLEVLREDLGAQKLYRKSGFSLREQYGLMTRPL